MEVEICREIGTIPSNMDFFSFVACVAGQSPDPNWKLRLLIKGPQIDFAQRDVETVGLSPYNREEFLRIFEFARKDPRNVLLVHPHNVPGVKPASQFRRGDILVGVATIGDIAFVAECLRK